MKRLLAIATLLFATPAMAADGDILLTFEQSDFDPGTPPVPFGCQVTVPCRCVARMYVWGRLAGASAGGITGAEYRIEVGDILPDPGWMFVETFVPGPTVLGTGALNPVDSDPRGVTLAWPSCQTGDGNMVLIETVDIFNVGCTTAQGRLRVARRDPATNPFFQCPLFVLCDAPVYTKVCLGAVATNCRNPEPPFPMNAMCSTSGEATLNPPPGSPECDTGPSIVNCTIPVQAESWTRVKALYRD